MDLAKRDTPLRSLPQHTFRRETTMPRQATDLPGLEVNATIHRPNTSKAQALEDLLGLASKVGQNIAGDITEANNTNAAAAAVLDFATGEKNDERFAKSHAYRDAWQLQGAKKMAIDVSQEVTDKFTAALNDPDHPATLDDLDQLFENSVKAHLVDEQGQPLNFITPQAKTVLGNALMKLKAELMPQAAKAITTQQNTKLFSTTYSNMLFERDAGQPVGAPPPKDPLAPLPDTAKAPPQVVEFGEPTHKLPIQGAVTSSYAAHLRRGSHGVDIDGRMGEPVQAPAGGKVTVGRDARSGLFVKIDHGGGVVSSYAHLSDTSLKTGDVVKAGATLGLVGNSGHTVAEGGGDGSHLHWRIRVDGRDVNPLTYSFKGGGSAVLADGTEPKLQAAQAAPNPLRPGFDVEGFMASMPPSVDKGEAKEWLLSSLAADAMSKGDSSLLNGLENSKRKDGTPSFTPEERQKIVAVRERVEDKARTDADRAEREMQETNAKSVLQAIVDGKPPSEDWLAEQSRRGLLDENFVYSMVNHMDEQRKQDAREARSEARQAQAETDADTDALIYGMEAQRRSGDLSGASYAEDLARFHNGELGTGKKAAARLLRLQAATKAGQAMTEQNPEFAFYSSKLKTEFKPRKLGGSIPSILAPKAVVDEPTYQAMTALYEQKVHAGEKPADAYDEAVKRYAPKGGNKQDPRAELSDIRRQMEEMRRRRRGG